MVWLIMNLLYHDVKECSMEVSVCKKQYYRDGEKYFRDYFHNEISIIGNAKNFWIIDKSTNLRERYNY